MLRCQLIGKLQLDCGSFISLFYRTKWTAILSLEIVARSFDSFIDIMADVNEINELLDLLLS